MKHFSVGEVLFLNANIRLTNLYNLQGTPAERNVMSPIEALNRFHRRSGICWALWSTNDTHVRELPIGHFHHEEILADRAIVRRTQFHVH